MESRKVTLRIDRLLGENLETNNDTTAVDTQRRGKHAFTTIFTVGNGVFYSVRAKEVSRGQMGRPSQLKVSL
jgi:hypothetical protein